MAGSKENGESRSNSRRSGPTRESKIVKSKKQQSG